MTADFDVVVAGSGPAGAATALVAARAGLSVCLLERGPFPGSKNMYGGVIYARVLDELIPRWWEEAPVERWVTRRSTMMLTETQSASLDFRTTAWGAPPYNGATALRPEFDRWLAGKAVEAGATLVTSTTATGLLRSGGRVTGVTTDREQGEVRGSVVVACDGVNSFLAREAGLYPGFSAEHLTLGVKEVLGFPRSVIEDRFGLRHDQGADIEVVGGTRGLPGGGFIYTNRDSVAIGVVVSLVEHGQAGHRPEDLIADFKAHPSILPLIEGGTLLEYSAHLIPEGGYRHMPELSMDGMLVAGDAAGMCLAAGLWLEGVNFAIGSGIAAGEAVVEALRARDTSKAGLTGYRGRLQESFVLADHERYRDAPELVLSQRVQQRYPAVVCGMLEEMFTVTNPVPKRGAVRILLGQLKRNRIRWRHLLKDGWQDLQDVPMSKRTYPEIGFEERMATVEFRVSSRPHIVLNADSCRGCSTQACVTACPAALFVVTADGGVVFNYEQCFECGTCYLVCDQEGALTWSYPDGGYGVVLGRG